MLLNMPKKPNIISKTIFKYLLLGGINYCRNQLRFLKYLLIIYGILNKISKN